MRTTVNEFLVFLCTLSLNTDGCLAITLCGSCVTSLSLPLAITLCGSCVTSLSLSLSLAITLCGSCVMVMVMVARRSHFTGHVSLLYFANTKWLPQGKVASIVSHQERFYKDAHRRLAVPAFRSFRRHIVHHTCHRVMSCMPSSKWQ